MGDTPRVIRLPSYKPLKKVQQKWQSTQCRFRVDARALTGGSTGSLDLQSTAEAVQKRGGGGGDI